MDATGTDVPFGFLPFSVADKPVILVEGYRENMRTPPTPPEAREQATNTQVNIVTDGSARGEVELDLRGMSAARARASFRDATDAQTKKWIEQVFSSEGHLGSGSMEQDGSNLTTGPYRMKVSFAQKRFIHRPGAGAFRIEPLIPLHGSINSHVESMIDTVGKHDTTCSGGKSTEKYTYKLPDDMELLAVPEDMAVEAAHIRYTATYRVEDNTLTVVRTFDDRTPGNVCSPQLLEQQRDLGLRIIRNLNSQAVYR